MPLSANSKRPIFWLMAPVNAPRSCPKSSDSSSPEGIAAQLIFTNVRSRRGLRLWMARAKSSLPVPVSPRSSTVVPAGAASSTCPSARFNAALSPIISSKLNSLRISSSRYNFSTASLSFSASISLNASAFSTAIAICAPTGCSNSTSAGVKVSRRRLARFNVPKVRSRWTRGTQQIACTPSARRIFTTSLG